MNMTPDNAIMHIDEIRSMLLHRYPFLLIDRVTELETSSYIRAYKNITFNEPFFQGHFPGFSLMPGVLTLEAMTQASAILGIKTHDAQNKSRPGANEVCILVGADRVRYLKPVVPGDKLELHVKILKVKASIWKYQAQALVDGVPACNAVIYCKSEDKRNLGFK